MYLSRLFRNRRKWGKDAFHNLKCWPVTYALLIRIKIEIRGKIIYLMPLTVISYCLIRFVVPIYYLPADLKFEFFLDKKCGRGF